MAMGPGMRPLLALFLLIPACGGQIILGAPDSGEVPVTSVVGAGENAGDGGSSASNGGSSDSNFPVCPGQEPKAGYTCTTPNQGCAYVNLQQKTCESWTCSANHVWVSSTPAGC